MKVKFSLIAAAAAVMFVSAARADTVTATLSSPLEGQQNAQISSPVLHSTEAIGGYNWTGATGTGPTGTRIANDTGPGTFRAYCLELTQGVSFGGTFSYTVSALENAPVPTQTASSLGLYGKADTMRKLFSVVLGGLGGQPAEDPNTMTGDYAAAMQLAIWDIEYDTASALGNAAYSLETGDFTVLNASANVISIADAWLGALSQGQVIGGVFALTSGAPDNSQDQIVYSPGSGPTIPLPTAALGGLALMSGLVGRRRMGLSA